MSFSRLRIIFRAQDNDERSCVLRGLDPDGPLVVPDKLRALVSADSWAGRTFQIGVLASALENIGAEPSAILTERSRWDVDDAVRVEIDLSLPLLLLARSLVDAGLDGTLEIAST